MVMEKTRPATFDGEIHAKQNGMSFQLNTNETFFQFVLYPVHAIR